MVCKGCYKEESQEFCPKCRKKLHIDSKMSGTLTFAAPKSDNLHEFQRNTTRLSISGVQLKYSLQVLNKRLVLTDTGCT